VSPLEDTVRDTLSGSDPFPPSDRGSCAPASIRTRRPTRCAAGIWAAQQVRRSARRPELSGGREGSISEYKRLIQDNFSIR